MKVAHIKSPFLPFSETFIYNYVNNLNKYKPIIITETQLNNDQFQVDNIIIHRTGKEWYEPAIRTFRNWLAGKIQREFVYRKFYLEALKKAKPHVVHIHFGVPGMMLSRLIKGLNLPFLVSFYGYDLSQIPSVLGEDVYIRNGLFNNGQIFTAEGSCAKQKLLELGCPKEKAYLLRIGINVKKYKYLLREKISNKPVKILFCGRFVEKKGLLIAIKSIAKVIDSGQKLFFNIIGDGPQKHEAINLVKNLSIEKYVSFLGILNHDQFIEECYNNHIFVAPSKTDNITGETEGGAPTVLLEAQATGMPVVASKHADIPEVVVDKKSGLLVEEGNVNGFYEAIVKLINRCDAWDKMGNYGRNHIIKLHDIRIVTQKLEELYDMAIKMNS